MQFFNWSVSHDAAVTFLIGNESFYSDVPKFLQCEQQEFAAGRLSPKCFDTFCTKCHNEVVL